MGMALNAKIVTLAPFVCSADEPMLARPSL